MFLSLYVIFLYADHHLPSIYVSMVMMMSVGRLRMQINSKEIINRIQTWGGEGICMWRLIDITVLKQKFSKIVKSRLQQGGRGANSVATKNDEERWVMSGQVRCPSLWYRYVDRHNSIKFTIEFEQDNEIPFLDVLVKRCPNNTFVTSIYRNKTFTGLYTKWDSFTPRNYKINVFSTLTYCCYRICPTAFLLQLSALDDL